MILKPSVEEVLRYVPCHEYRREEGRIVLGPNPHAVRLWDLIQWSHELKIRAIIEAIEENEGAHFKKIAKIAKEKFDRMIEERSKGIISLDYYYKAAASSQAFHEERRRRAVMGQKIPPEVANAIMEEMGLKKMVTQAAFEYLLHRMYEAGFIDFATERPIDKRTEFFKRYDVVYKVYGTREAVARKGNRYYLLRLRPTNVVKETAKGKKVYPYAVWEEVRRISRREFERLRRNPIKRLIDELTIPDVARVAHKEAGMGGRYYHVHFPRVDVGQQREFALKIVREYYAGYVGYRDVMRIMRRNIRILGEIELYFRRKTGGLTRALLRRLERGAAEERRLAREIRRRTGAERFRFLEDVWRRRAELGLSREIANLIYELIFEYRRRERILEEREKLIRRFEEETRRPTGGIRLRDWLLRRKREEREILERTLRVMSRYLTPERYRQWAPRIERYIAEIDRQIEELRGVIVRVREVFPMMTNGGVSLRKALNMDIRTGFYAEDVVASVFEEFGEEVVQRKRVKGEIDIITQRFAVEVKNRIDPIEKYQIKEFLRKAPEGKKPVYIAPFFSKKAKDYCKKHGVLVCETGKKLIEPEQEVIGYNEWLGLSENTYTTDPGEWKEKIRVCLRRWIKRKIRPIS
ncbi:MAG: hypothetical protein ACTSXC_07225 [Candidatus Freyarchaeota archaeon]